MALSHGLHNSADSCCRSSSGVFLSRGSLLPHLSQKPPHPSSTILWLLVFFFDWMLEILQDSGLMPLSPSPALTQVHLCIPALVHCSCSGVLPLPRHQLHPPICFWPTLFLLWIISWSGGGSIYHNISMVPMMKYSFQCLLNVLSFPVSQWCRKDHRIQCGWFPSRASSSSCMNAAVEIYQMFPNCIWFHSLFSLLRAI